MIFQRNAVYPLCKPRASEAVGEETMNIVVNLVISNTNIIAGNRKIPTGMY